MTIFTRYIIWEVLKYFLLALLALTMVVTVGMGVKEGLSKGLPAGVIIRTLPLMVPEMLGITIPVAMLYAVSSVFARMSGSNEIVALKSLGLSPMRILWPVIGLAVVLSLVTVWIYEISAVWCRPTVRRVVVESVEDIAYGMLQAERSFRSQKFDITVKRVEGRNLVKPTIVLHAEGDRPAVTVKAEEAQLRSDLREGVLVFVCHEGEIDVEGQMRFSFPDTIQQVVPLDKPDRPIHRDWLSTPEIHSQVERVEGEIAQAQANPNTDPAHLKDLRRLYHRLQTEPYRRWSNGFSSLCFVLIGAPVAMLRRNSDALMSFFICFLPILAIYYPLLMIGEDLSTSGALPPYAFWMSNLMMVGPGIWLLRRTIRH